MDRVGAENSNQPVTMRTTATRSNRPGVPWDAVASDPYASFGGFRRTSGIGDQAAGLGGLIHECERVA